MNSYRYTISLVILSFLLFSPGLTSGAETDATKVIPEPALSLPTTGITYSDPAFGTPTTRLKDAKGDGLRTMVPEYSNIQAWNADMTKMFIRTEASGGHRIVDSETFAVLDTIGGVLVQSLRWSPTDPDVMYYSKEVGDHKLYKYTVSLKREEVLRDFGAQDGCYIGTDVATRDANYEEMSDDGRWMAISGETAAGLVCILAYDVINDVVSPVYVSTQGRTSSNYNWVMMSPLGDYVLVLWDSYGYTRESGLEAFDRATMQFVGQVHEGTGHSDVTLDPVTNTQYLVVDNANNAYGSISGLCIVKARIPDGVASGTNTCLIKLPQFHNMHISCQASKPRQPWCAVSTYGSQFDFDNGWSAFEDEIFKIYLDSTEAVPHVERLAHHRSQPVGYTQDGCAGAGTYWAQPHATVRRDGSQILYGSNWRRVCDSTDLADPFILTISAVWTKMNPTAVGSSAYIGQSWLDSQGLPAWNAWFPMTFDSQRNVTVAFGGGRVGYYTNDLWHYDYKQDQWILVEPARDCPNDYTWPNGRDTHGLIYDNINDLYWTFGGSTRFCQEPTSDILDAQQYSAWHYDPDTRTWGFVRANQGWFTHLNSGFAFSPDDKFITVFAGDDWTDNSLWAIDVEARQWTQLIPPSAPGSPPKLGQIENAMVYDSFNKVFILFGVLAEA